MKKSRILFLASTLLLTALVGCTNELPTSSSSSSSSDTSLNSSSSSSSSSKEELENIISILDVSNDLEPTTLTEDFMKGPFTIVSGTKIRARNKTWKDPSNNSNTKSFTNSIQYDSSNSALKVKSNGEGTLDIYVQNGSGSAQTNSVSFIKTGGATTNVTFPGKGPADGFEGYTGTDPVVKVTINVKDGEEYTIKRGGSGTIDIFYAELNVMAQKSEVVGFEIASEGKVDYIEGETYDSSKIKLNAVYGNGRKDPLDMSSKDISIDASKVNTSTPGTYNVSVKYKNYEAKTIAIKVYEFKDIELGFNKIVEGEKSKAGNSLYVNKSVKTVYKANETLNYDNLTVTASCSLGDNDNAEFILDNNAYSVTSTDFNSNTDGTYDVNVNVTLNNKTKSKTYKVSVVSTSPSLVSEEVHVKVNPAYEGKIGEVSDSSNQFKTIGQALEYLTNLGSDYDTKRKVIELSEGTYKEKLEINLSNLTIKGSNKENTIIEWDSLYGQKDESGYEHTTDSTQSVAVRDNAINCIIEGVTISNYFNSEAHFTERFGEGKQDEHRALALLVQADKFLMKDSKLLGYQDTLELFTGRQIFQNTYICGTTDFIFGTNNTTYFKGCEIHSIANIKNNGGYVTAFKGMNKDASDAITYGAIFDACNFNADESILNLTSKKTALGRCWGAYASVMVMNSTLAKHISTTTSTYAQGDRYVAMNASPADTTVKFKEYNNTGDGALTTGINGMQLITDATEAAKYNNFQIIFGEENGYTSTKGYDTWNVTLS